MRSANFHRLSLESTDRDSFIEFWSRQYGYPKEHLYDSNITVNPMTDASLLALFEWKNGSVLSEKKRKSIEPYQAGGERVGADVDARELKSFLCRPGGAIWRIFWLHLQHPTRFPIYDQHVHRAMANIKGWDDVEIPPSASDKITLYVDEYVPFVKTLGDGPIRQIDRALWAYGRFLSLGYKF